MYTELRSGCDLVWVSAATGNTPLPSIMVVLTLCYPEAFQRPVIKRALSLGDLTSLGQGFNLPDVWVLISHPLF